MDPTEDIEQKLFSSYFIEKHVFTVQSIEKKLNEINLERRKKRRKLSSHGNDKDRTVRHKKRKGTLPRIAYPAKKNTSGAEFSYDTSHIDKEKGVNDRKDGNNEKNDEEKEAECPDDTPPVDMEEGVSDIKNDDNEKMMRKRGQNAQITLPLLIWRKV